MTIAYRSNSVATDNSTDEITVNKPGGVISGDLLVATVAYADDGGFSTPSGWTLLTSYEYSSGGDQGSYAIFYKIAGGSEPASYTFEASGLTSADFIGMIAAFSGVDSVDKISDSDMSTDDSGSLSTAIAPSVTANGSDGILITGVGAYDASTAAGFIPPSGHTKINGVDQDTVSFSIGYEALSSSGSTGTGTRTWNYSGLNFDAYLSFSMIVENPAGGSRVHFFF